jgi:hypothetical protein
MIEYGLSVSVSLDGTPRTPHCCDYGPSPVNNAPRKYMSFGDFIGGGGGDGGDGVSVSPRVLFSDVAVVAAARRLDFSSIPLNTSDLSPVSFASASVASVAAASSSVGDCSVCYNVLPARSNHVFTLCGHLFCVRCVLKWWDTNSTCPICRAELFETVVDNDDVSVGTAAGGADADADSDDSDDNRLIRYIYGDTNNNNNIINNGTSDSDDSDSDDSDSDDSDSDDRDELMRWGASDVESADDRFIL